MNLEARAVRTIRKGERFLVSLPAKIRRMAKNPSALYVWVVYAHDPGYSHDKLHRGSVEASSKTEAIRLGRARYQRSVAGSHGMLKEVITVKRGRRI